MNNTIDVSSLGAQDPVDNVSFDKAEEAAIDMTEIIDYDKQTKVTKMVSGVENFLNTGAMDSTTALYLGVKVAGTKMDPTGGQYNSRFGGEGFFATALKTLENGILAIIRFVKKIVLWIVEKVKQVFGFSPSDRQAAAIAEKLPAMKSELAGYLTVLGFPSNLCSVEKYLEDMPTDKRRNAQLRYLSSKLVKDEDYFNQFTDIPAHAQQVMKLLGEGVRRARMAKKTFTNKLDKLVRDNKGPGSVITTEGEELIESMLSIARALNYREVIPSLSKITQIFANKTIEDHPDDKFNELSIELNRIISACITRAEKEADANIVKKVEQVIAKISAESYDKLEIEQNFNMKELYDLTDADELAKVSKLSQLTNDPRYLDFYRMVTTAASTYSNFAKITVEIMRNVSNTYSDISNWYRNAVKFMLAAVADDVKTICELMLKQQQEYMRRKEPMPIEIHPNGMPKNLTSMSEADAQTVMEKMAHMSSETINLNLLNVKNSINNFAKEAGLGKIA